MEKQKISYTNYKVGKGVSWTVGTIIVVGVGASGWVGVGTSVGVGVAVGSPVGDGDGDSDGEVEGTGVGHAFGSVPRIKYSVAEKEAMGSEDDPVGRAMRQGWTFTMDAGLINGSRAVPARNRSIRSLQIGAAPKDPATLSISELSLLPTQTPITRLGVYPIVNASR